MLLAALAVALPVTAALAAVKPLWPPVHDGVISMLRSYSRSAFMTLAGAVDPDMRVSFVPTGVRFPPGAAVLLSVRWSAKREVSPRGTPFY